MNRSSNEWCDHNWNLVTGYAACDYIPLKSENIMNSMCGDIRSNLARNCEYTEIGHGLAYDMDHFMLNEAGNKILYPFGTAFTRIKERQNVPEELKTGSIIHVCNMADLFMAPDEWILDVLSECEKHQEHTFLFSQNRYSDEYRNFYSLYPDAYCGSNMWYGIDVMTIDELKMIGRMPWMENLNTFMIVYPTPWKVEYDNQIADDIVQNIKWCVFTDEKGRGKLDPKFIFPLMDLCIENGIPVFVCDNMREFVEKHGCEALKQKPDNLEPSRISKKREATWIANCAICRKRGKKSEYITISAKSKRKEPAQVFTYMCKTCFRNFCSMYKIKIPDLKGLQDGK